MKNKEIRAKKAKFNKEENISDINSQVDLFEDVWNEREHKSEISGETLLPKGHGLWHWQFMHVLPKSIYPSMKLKSENIILGTYEEHITQTRHPNKTKMNPNWNKFWAKYDELKEAYLQNKGDK